MNISNITDTIGDYNNTIISNHTIDVDSKNGNIEIVIPLISIIPCGMSLIFLIGFIAYTLVKPLINKK